MSTRTNIFRTIRTFVYLALLVFLILYGEKKHPGVTYSECLANPLKYENTPVEIGTEATIHAIYPDFFVIKQVPNYISIMGPAPEKAHIGEFVTLSGIFKKDGSIQPKAVRIAEKRRQKIWVSIVPIFLVVGLFFSTFKWNSKQFKFLYR